MLSSYTCHVDTFTRDNLPPRELMPQFLFNRPELQYPERLNAAEQLVDVHVAAGLGNKMAVIGADHAWTYGQLQGAANRVAQVLMEDFGLLPGHRVLLRGYNNAMCMAIWLGIVKAGGVVVATMPMLRAAELKPIIDKAEIALAVSDGRLMSEIEAAQKQSPHLRRVVAFGGGELEERMARKDGKFRNVPTGRDDVVLLAFTSGTTGKPKATMHFHRDVLAISHAFGQHVLRPSQDDVFTGSPPYAFTFGLGALVSMPLAAGATVAPLEQSTPDIILDTIERHKVTTLFTAPTMYKALLAKASDLNMSSLKACVSAGEHLPKPTAQEWAERMGFPIIDGIGSTEMTHIFISAAGKDVRFGATGRTVPGYEARIVDENMNTLPPGEVGRLAVRGPTGCRYLADERQTVYVNDGWNLTGDAFLMDEEGYFWFQARNDDMIISAGYNIAGPEVEEALLSNTKVMECAVVGVPDEARGHIVKAFVVLKPGIEGTPDVVKELQDHVKNTIAPFKYPRAVEFVDSLPKTGTGKIQRFKLRQQS